MSKFKVGDRVRCTEDCGDEFSEGREYEVSRVYTRGGTEWICVKQDDRGFPDNGWAAKYFELVQPASPSPVRTKKVIVPGRYGQIEVGGENSQGVCIWFPPNGRYTATELTDIINTLTPIRDALADALEA